MYLSLASQGPSVAPGDAVGRRTPATRRSSWRRSFTSTGTSRGDVGSRLRTRCASRSDRLKYGSRTGGWSGRRRTSWSTPLLHPLLLPLRRTVQMKRRNGLSKTGPKINSCKTRKRKGRIKEKTCWLISCLQVFQEHPRIFFSLSLLFFFLSFFSSPEQWWNNGMGGFIFIPLTSTLSVGCTWVVLYLVIICKTLYSKGYVTVERDRYDKTWEGKGTWR